MAEPATPQPVPPSSEKNRKFQWGFLTGGGVLILLCLYFAIPWGLADSLLNGGGIEAKSITAIKLFLALLPYTVFAVWKPKEVFAFLKSIKVGVFNLMLIVIGSIIGVLFFQENPYDPIPEGGVESLAQLVDSGETRAWTLDEKIAYDKYAGISGRSASFRNAHAFFAYRFAESMHMDSVFDLDSSLDIDEDGIQKKLDILAKWI